MDDVDTNVLKLLYSHLYKATNGLTVADFDRIDVQAQVVAGINYKFQLYLDDMMLEVVIWRKLDGSVKAVSSEIMPLFADTEEQYDESDTVTEVPYEEEP